MGGTPALSLNSHMLDNLANQNAVTLEQLHYLIQAKIESLEIRTSEKTSNSFLCLSAAVFNH